MQAIGFIVRDGAGNVSRGTVGVDGVVPVSGGQEISLNLSASAVQSYSRDGSDLKITLANGDVITISGYFEGSGAKLYLSDNGQLQEVALSSDGGDGLFASYQTTAELGKWSPADDLMFYGRPEVVTQAADGGFLGGMGLGLPAAIAGVGLAGLALAGGGGDGDGGGGGAVAQEWPVAVDEGDQVLGGDDTPEPSFEITGTGTPGDTVEVKVGDEIVTTVVDDDGMWGVVFEGETLPVDGSYVTEVVITDPDGGQTDLTGPTIVIDTTPPVLALDPVEGDNLINAADESDGVTLTGTSEAGATVTVVVAGESLSTTADENGVWSVTYPQGTFAGGEYTQAVEVTAVDAIGNSTVITGSFDFDTVTDVTIDATSFGGDAILNGVEAAAGFTLTGTAEPGASVVLSHGELTYSVTTGEDGTWSVDIPGGDMKGGEYDAVFTATATDAAGNVATATHTFPVDTEVTITIDDGYAGADGIIGADEAAEGVTLTGGTKPGTTVTVTYGGIDYPAEVNADGDWSLALSPEQIAEGTYNTPLYVTAQDAAGNTGEITTVMNVDTETFVTADLSTVETDGLINGVEAADGVVLTGTTEPGASVEVTLGGVTRPAVVAADGSWTAAFEAGDIPSGETDASVSVIATDAAGNTATTGGSIPVDTLVLNLDIDTPIATDNIINGAEQDNGVILTGTVEAGSQVMISLGGAERPAAVSADGTWEVMFPADEIPEGDYTSEISAVATDAVGNVAEVETTVAVDTFVAPLNFAPGLERDDIINAEEASDGITITGEVEQGATVEVTFEGTTRTATVNHGTWSATFAANEVPSGTYTATATVVATDIAGNTHSESNTYTVDTENPEAPLILSFSKGLSGVRSVGTEANDDITQVQQLAGDGTVSNVAYDLAQDDVFNELVFSFAEPIPDGSHLVVTSTDAAGNQAGTLFVLEDTVTSLVDLNNPGLESFDIQAVDLQFATDAELTITEQQLADLSGFTNELTIHGTIDDVVTATGAQSTGETRDIEGQTYSVYTLGDQGTLIIDDEISVIT